MAIETTHLKYIEFAHKSFREYLVAEKIFTFFQESIYQKRFDQVRWFTLGRKLPKVEEINFLKDLIYTLPNDELIWLFNKMKILIPLLASTRNLTKIMNNINFEDKNEFNTVYYRSLNLSALAYIVGNVIYFKLVDKVPQIKNKLEIAHFTNYIYHICRSTPSVHLSSSQYNQNWITAKTFMSGINLSKFNLDGIEFDGAELDMANFHDSSLRRCSFARSRPIFADFSYAVCDGADFSQSYCNSTNFTNTFLYQVSFKNAQFYFVKFINTEFINVDFSDSVFEKCTFVDCIFKNVLAKDVQVNNCKGLPVLKHEQWNNPPK